jgi:hypothetical protein
MSRNRRGARRTARRAARRSARRTARRVTRRKERLKIPVLINGKPDLLIFGFPEMAQIEEHTGAALDELTDAEVLAAVQDLDIRIVLYGKAGQLELDALVELNGPEREAFAEAAILLWLQSLKGQGSVVGGEVVLVAPWATDGGIRLGYEDIEQIEQHTRTSIGRLSSEALQDAMEALGIDSMELDSWARKELRQLGALNT